MPVCSILICDLKKNDSGEYSFRFVGNSQVIKWATENVTLKVEGKFEICTTEIKYCDSITAVIKIHCG